MINLVTNFIDSDNSWELLIYDNIGLKTENSPGYFASQFAEELAKIPTNADIKIRLNSRGGDLAETQTICTLLKERKGHTTCQIDGVCMSCATLIACACDKVTMRRGGLYMIHNPQTRREGDIYEMLEGAQILSEYKDYALLAYCDKTKRPKEEISAMMDRGTFMNANQAKEFGFVDEVIEDSVTAFYEGELKDLKGIPDDFLMLFNHKTETMDNKNPQPVQQATPAPQENVGKDEKTTMIASDEITMLAQKSAAFEKEIAEMKAAETARKEAEAEAKKNEVTMLVQEAVKDGRIANTEQDTWINGILANPSMMGALAKLNKAPKAEPIEREPIMQGDISINDIEKRVAMFDKAGQSKEKYAFLMKHGDKLFEPLAKMAITVSSGLKRDAIFTNAITDFYINWNDLLGAFAQTWADIPREGNDTVQIPWVVRPNAADVVKDYNPAVGLETGSRQTNSIPIVLNKHKTVGLEYTSLDIQKYPYSMVYDHVRNMLDSLIEVVVPDILSAVTSTNYTGVVDENGVDPEDFDRTDVVKAVTAADEAKWPERDRYLVLNAQYKEALMNDPSLATWAGLAQAGVNTTENAKFGKLYGFTPIFNAFLPSNSQKLVGFICRREALGIVGAPVKLTPELAQVCSYETLTDPATGCTVGLQHWADPTTRTVKHAFEILYGYAPIRKDSLIRFISATA